MLRPATNILGLQYGKVTDMYASQVVKADVDGSGLVPQISELRTELGVGLPLSTEKALAGKQGGLAKKKKAPLNECGMTPQTRKAGTRSSASQAFATWPKST